MIDPLEQLKQEMSLAMGQAREALNQKREQEQLLRRDQERKIKLVQYQERVVNELKIVHDELAKTVAEAYELGEDHPTYLVLNHKLNELSVLMTQPEEMALRLYADEESKAILQADQQIMAQRLDEWRRNLAEDIRQTILAADEYFIASDVAIYVNDYREDLVAIGCFEEMVEILVKRINDLDNSDKPPKEIRGHARTLDWLVDFAQKQRLPRTMLGGDGGIARLRQASRKTPRPFTYGHLAGQVVVFGGHPNMSDGVRERLVGSQVELIWFDMEQADTQVRDRSDVVKDADLVILVTPYASHKFQDIARAACKRHSQELVPCNKTGLTSLLDIVSQRLAPALTEESLGAEDLNGGLEALANKYGRRR
ncbi:DUF2325 domain-containing protein [Candidatus Cyanaurora vandensis]|uniref:DUF2325 domain-containing protein n=1 Tax=Candidatus Cyanaurora vandensis TaxID=2714958 RepID=UPI00257FB710|nr:DUF2325 domain-containing protein [Candidatus Cyanaurora vandensis]